MIPGTKRGTGFVATVIVLAGFAFAPPAVRALAPQQGAAPAPSKPLPAGSKPSTKTEVPEVGGVPATTGSGSTPHADAGNSQPAVKKGQLFLSALMAHDSQPIVKAPLRWRIFSEKTNEQGQHELVTSSNEPSPAFTLPLGTYIVHVSLDLASAVRRITVTSQASSERLILNAGALRIVGMLGDKPINPAKLAISIYVPEAGNSEAKLVLSTARAGDLIAVPEGNYHVVSTLLDTAGYSGTQKSGVGNKTNSVVSADLKVQAAKLTDATLRHHSAVMTLKLVNTAGGEALANTAFTILTPGGDVIRELIGAFPSVVLAEGEYVVIARHDTKTYQATFKVTSTMDRDVEVSAK